MFYSPSFHFSSSEELAEKTENPRAYRYARGDINRGATRIQDKSSHVRYTLCKITVAYRRSLLISFQSALESPFTRRLLPQSHRLRLSARQALRDTSLSHRFVVYYSRFILICQWIFKNLSFPVFSVQRAIHYCLCNMVGINSFHSVKVCYSSCNPEHSVMTSCRKTKTLKRISHKA